MVTNSVETMKFVLLLEEHKDVLLISQAADLKQKKTEAAGKITLKWTELSGKTLSQACLFKKINNLKSRAKMFLNSGKTLSDWQAKLLEIVGTDVEPSVEPSVERVEADDDRELTNSTSNITVSNQITGNTSSSNNACESKSAAELLLEKYETDETKLLNKEQLHRFVLLKQVKILTMQQERLERSQLGITHIDNGKEITFDFVGWDTTN